MITIPTSQTQETLLEVLAALQKTISDETIGHFQRMQSEATSDTQMRFSSGVLAALSFVLNRIEIGKKQARESNEISFDLPSESQPPADVTVSASV